MRANFVVSEVAIGLRRNLTLTLAAIITTAVSLALRYAGAQGLLQRPLTLDEVWAGLPAGCED